MSPPKDKEGGSLAGAPTVAPGSALEADDQGVDGASEQTPAAGTKGLADELNGELEQEDPVVKNKFVNLFSNLNDFLDLYTGDNPDRLFDEVRNIDSGNHQAEFFAFLDEIGDEYFNFTKVEDNSKEKILTLTYEDGSKKTIDGKVYEVIFWKRYRPVDLSSVDIELDGAEDFFDGTEKIQPRFAGMIAYLKDYNASVDADQDKFTFEATENDDGEKIIILHFGEEEAAYIPIGDAETQIESLDQFDGFLRDNDIGLPGTNEFTDYAKQLLEDYPNNQFAGFFAAIAMFLGKYPGIAGKIFGGLDGYIERSNEILDTEAIDELKKMSPKLEEGRENFNYAGDMGKASLRYLTSTLWEGNKALAKTTGVNSLGAKLANTTVKVLGEDKKEKDILLYHEATKKDFEKAAPPAGTIVIFTVGEGKALAEGLGWMGMFMGTNARTRMTGFFYNDRFEYYDNKQGKVVRLSLEDFHKHISVEKIFVPGDYLLNAQYLAKNENEIKETEKAHTDQKKKVDEERKQFKVLEEIYDLKLMKRLEVEIAELSPTLARTEFNPPEEGELEAKEKIYRELLEKYPDYAKDPLRLNKLQEELLSFGEIIPGTNTNVFSIVSKDHVPEEVLKEKSTVLNDAEAKLEELENKLEDLKTRIKPGESGDK